MPSTPPDSDSVALKRLMGPRNGLEAAVMIMAALMTGFTLWAIREFLTPFALAVFLLLMIDGLARGLVKRVPSFPEKAALPAAIVFIVAVFGLSIWAIAVNAGHFVGQSAAYTQKLNQLLQQLSSHMGIEVPPTLDDVLDQVNPSNYIGAIAREFRRVGEGAILVLVYLGFLIASRQGFAAKADALFPSTSERGEAARVFEHIRAGIESYILVQTTVGALGAAASLVIMTALGLHHAFFWAFLIFLAGYIPVVGAAVGVLIPPIFGLVDFADPWHSLVLLILLEAQHFIVAQILAPRMQGKNLNLDPLVVLLSLAFWTLIWGVPGAFLSTPLTVMAMAVLAEFSPTRWIAVLLSRDGRPYSDAAPFAPMTASPEASSG
jgi:predicted PurR-regulated permease PerM